ncbi:MAG: glycosyltransferase family 4 protein [Mesonia hippocampi]|uniref:glycosyltransferase family 4 protein n=1 Tax=Mesonia hippocampi TaxID=1628250 RepID=UPI003F9745B7
MKKKLLIIGYLWPEPSSSAAGSRMMQLITYFLYKKYEITYASPASETPFSEKLEDLGIKKVQLPLNNREADVVLKNEQPDVVLFDRFMMEEQFGWRVAEQLPKAIRILDTEDLHFLRKARHKAHKNGKAIKLSDLHTDIAKREIASILRCDLSLIISETEQQLLIDKFSINPSLLFYLPFLIEENKIPLREALPAFEARENFLFIGNFLHEPNWDAVRYIKTELWSEIRKNLPQAKFNVYGAYTSEKVKQLHCEKSGFIVCGRADSSEEVMRKSRVLLAPLRFGAGLKGKFIEAMLCGTPSVTTTVGAEGIGGKWPWAGEIANETSEIIKQAVTLYTHPKRWGITQNNGFNIIKNRFLTGNFYQLFSDRLTKLYENLAQHRVDNFMGEILHHHTTRSTKYMALWIEEKNKEN